MYRGLSATQQTVCESETFYRTLCGHWGKIRESHTVYCFQLQLQPIPILVSTITDPIFKEKNMYNIPHKTQENMQGVVASDFHKVESRNCL